MPKRKATEDIEGKIDKGITTKQMLKKLRDKIKEHGGQAELARLWGVTPQSLSNAVTCIKLPSPAILKAMGLTSVKEIKYRYKDVK